MNVEESNLEDLKTYEARLSNWLAVGFWILMSKKGIGDPSFVEGVNFNYLEEYDRMVGPYLKKILESLKGFTVVRVCEELENFYRIRSKENKDSVDQEIRQLAIKHNPNISEPALAELLSETSGESSEFRGPSDNAKNRIKYIFPDTNSGRNFVRNHKDLYLKNRELAQTYNLALDFFNTPFGTSLILFIEGAALDEEQTKDLINFVTHKNWIPTGLVVDKL